MKLTKRKQFAFYRSYYDVFNELEYQDKITFIEALLDKQFLDIDPVNLTGMVKFAYISQMDSIEKQVKGYQDKTKVILNPSKGVKTTPRQGVELPPSQQEEEKEEEKEEYTYSESDFLVNWNQLREHYLKTPSHLNKLMPIERDLFKDLENNFTKEDYHKALRGLFKQERVPANVMWFKPKHFLENKETYLDAELNKNYKLYV